MDDLKKGGSMLVTYKGKQYEIDKDYYVHEVEWEVTVGKKEFTLNEDQVKILKDASQAGKTSLVWYKDFAISIPHILSIELAEDNYLRLNFQWHTGMKDFLNVGGYIDKEEYEKHTTHLSKTT